MTDGLTAERTAEILDLVHDLGDCKDTREVFVASTSRFARLFGPYATYGHLVSDVNNLSWRVLCLKNPEMAEGRGILASDLASDTDVDVLSVDFGTDVSWTLRQCPLLSDRLLQIGETFAATTSEPQLLDECRALLQANVKTVLISTWNRPIGGIGALFLAFDQDIPIDSKLMQSYWLAVKTTTRLSFYPGYVAYIARLQKTGESIRRNLVHDLKTPVTVIKGYAETLLSLDGQGDEAVEREMLEGIAEQTDRLLDDLKDLIEPFDEAWKPEIIEFDLIELAARAINREKHTARAKNHRFVLHHPDTPIVIHADRRKIRRVIENLLSNSVKYSPGDNKTVTITIQEQNGVASVTVADQGVGMTEKQLETVMESGGRIVHSQLDIEGSGFGLDSCKRALVAHQGNLIANSIYGVGSTFIASIPVRPLHQ